MPRLGNVPYRKVAQALRRLGFVPVRQRGSHVHFLHPDGRKTTVPHHAREPLGPRLIKGIMGDLGDDAEEFLDLL